MVRRLVQLTIAMGIAFSGSVAFAAPASAGTNVLVNGSFEWPRPRGAATSRSFDVGQHVGAWTVTAGSVVTTTDSPPFETPPVGVQAMNLRPGLEVGEGEICQTVSGLVAGGSYKVRLLAGSVIQSSTIDVTFGGAPVAHLDLVGALPAVFKLYVWTVTAPANEAVFCLHGKPVEDYGFPIVDAVRIKPISG